MTYLTARTLIYLTFLYVFICAAIYSLLKTEHVDVGQLHNSLKELASKESKEPDTGDIAEEQSANSGDPDGFEHRRKHLEQSCKDLAPQEKYFSLCGHVVDNSKRRLSWCYVPKTGCTFWKKIFLVMQSIDFDGKPLKLSNIGFWKAHLSALTNVCRFNSTKTVAEHLSGYDTMIFVRDPYSRLFSAYIDKFYLPDFWNPVGKHITKTFRNQSSSLSRLCGHDVTFKEFIDYVIRLGETGKELLWYKDDHWLPISKVCLPCRLPFKYIAKQETFSADRDKLLKIFHVNKFFNESFSRYNNSVRTISDKIEALWPVGMKRRCVSQVELMKRFWTAFQLQGYLPYNETLQENWDDLKPPFTAGKFQRLVIKVYTKYHNEDLKKQKVQGMVKGYTFLTLKQMRKLQKIYSLDFSLFGYDPEPLNLFSYFIPQRE